MNLKAFLAFNLNCHIRGKGLLNITCSYIYCKCGWHSHATSSAGQTY